MTDNLQLGPDASANHMLAVLRGRTDEGDLGEATDIGEGLALHADPALSLQGRWRTPPGRLLEIESRPQGTGGWLGLHLEVATPDLTGCGLIGFACRSTAPETLILRACLRSGTADGFADCFFDKHILSHDRDGIHLDVLTLQGRDTLPPQAPWRQFVLFLPPRAFDWSLVDLRLFAV